MENRLLDDWLSTYLEYTEPTEPPVSYHRWVGLGVLAGALQRKVWVEWGFDTIYPNLYVVLVAPSGRARKGTALAIGKDLLVDAKVAISSEATTREALIRAMAGNINNFQINGHVKQHCSLSCVSEELSVFLGTKDIRFLSTLTDWYDSKDSWTYETKGSGTDTLSGLCFNLLGATAPEWLQSMLPQEAIGGGFTSRVIFVVEKKKGKTVPIHHVTEEERKVRAALLHDLEIIHGLKGSFTVEPEAQEFYDDWYTKEDAKLQAGQLAVPDEHFASYCERRQTHLKKLSMVVSASEGSSLTIKRAHMERVIDYLTEVEPKMAGMFGGMGTAKHSEVLYKLQEFIKETGVTTRSVVMRKFSSEIGIDIDVLESTMEKMKTVRIETNLEANDHVYRWIG